MFDIFIRNFITLILLAGFIILLKTGDVNDKKTEKLLGIDAVTVTLLIIVDMGDAYLASLDHLNDLRYLTSALGYTLRPVALGIFITILLRKKNSIPFVWIPIAIVAVISITSYWTHLMFYFDANNEFIRGPLSYIAHFMSVCYMGILLYYAIIRFKIADLSEILTIFYIVIACLSAVFIETIFKVKFLVSGAIVSSCVVYYTYLYVQVYKTDPLTKVYDRTSFNKDVEKKLNKSMEIINVDLDNLKFINDTEGHLAGDVALCTVANVLVSVANNSYKVYRVGGDEFYVIGIDKSHASSKVYITNAKKLLSKEGLSASFGSARYNPGDDFGDRCIEADKNMYANKKHKPTYTKK